MKKIFRKSVAGLLVFSLVFPTITPTIQVSADRVTGEIEKKTESNANNEIEIDERHDDLYIDVETNAEAILINGSDVELSAYLVESIQGKQRGTYVPNLSNFYESDFAYEYNFSALRENRFFDEDNKRDYIFNQDGQFDLEYVEALNWLYKNNYLHNFENLDIRIEVDSKKSDNETVVFSANGTDRESTKEVTLESGQYYLEYNMYDSKDRLQVFDPSGTEILDTNAVKGTGNKSLTVGEKGTYTVIVNKGGSSEEDTVWDYAIYNESDNNYNTKYITKTNLSELTGEDSFLYPLNKDGSGTVINKKNYIMQLMKVVDGVEESRPLLIESQYEYTDIRGKTTPTTGVMSILQTSFKDDIGNTGLDIGVNNVSVDFDKYGMHKYYVNPNVYELYFEKAYNSGIIAKNEIADVRLLGRLENVQNFNNTSGDPTKLNSKVSRWDNSLPPIRINTTRRVNNNGDYNVDTGVRVFGSSWSDITKADSSTKVTGEIKYNPNYEYFKKPNVSYIEAVVYAYKAINAYADEKLPQREVDTIMSMYSVNYGRLTESEKEALNYLIAKGIIDGDNSAKYTSTENITVKDAVVMLYRIANPSARLTFKQVFESVDEAMLKRGYGQSKTSVKSYSDELPIMDIQSEEKDDYYIIMNKTLIGGEFELSDQKYSQLTIEGMEASTETYTEKELAELGLIIEKGTYTVRKYSIPWNANITKLGFTTREEEKNLPDWININIGGGFYYINEDLLDGETKELQFTHMYSNINADDAIDLDNLDGEDNIYEYNDGGFNNGADYNSRLDSNNSKSDSEKESEEKQRDNNNGEINDDNDPLDILSFNSTNQTSLTEITMPKYLNGDAEKESETVEVFLGINEKAKANLLFDGKPLFNNGKLNTDLISTLEDIKNIEIVEGVPSKSNGEEMSDKDVKTFIKFIYPKTGERSVNEIKSLIKRRLTLTGEAEIEDEDIASYTGLSNGQTMVSQKELKRFGITTSKEEPDVLYHESTDTYAYLNTDKDYALISNTVMTFPEDSMMIEITADDIYYNIEVVMSMMNDKDFYIFNKDGKYEVVKTLDELTLRNVLNPSTSKTIDKTYTANIKRYIDEDTDEKLSMGDYVNISAISGEPATFFMSTDKVNNNKRIIYGFEPYYVKSTASGGDTSKTANEVISDLGSKTSNMIHIENLLINNSIMRQEFFIPKSETFVYTDNAIKVTNLTKSASYNYYAQEYLNFIRNLYRNVSEGDVRSDAENLKDSNPLYSNKDFQLEDLLDRNLFVKGDSTTVKKLIAEVKKGRDVEAFWVLYFMDKFTIQLPRETGVDDETALKNFKKKLLALYNKNYSLKSSGFELDSINDLEILKTTTASETDITEKRLYNFKRMEAIKNEGLISTDRSIYVNRNEAVYLKLLSFNTVANTEPQYKSLTDKVIADSGFTTIEMNKYLANNNYEITDVQREMLDYQRDIIGTVFYQRNSGLFSPVYEQYATLPQGEKPLELYPNGTKFSIKNSDGSVEQYVVINNMVLVDGEVTVKVAKVYTKPIGAYAVEGNTEAEKVYNYYSNLKNYATSIKSLGKFSAAVNTNGSDYEHVIRSSEITSTLYNKNKGTYLYFDNTNKKANTVYLYLTDVGNGKNSSNFMQAYLRDSSSYTITDNVSSNKTKIMFNEETTLNFNDISKNGSDISLAKNLYGNKADIKERYMIYESFLFNYGTVSLSKDGYANLSIRSDYVLNSSAVLTDIVDELVKAVKKDRIEVDSKIVGDLVSGDKLILQNGSSTAVSMTVLKTSTKDKNGYSHFISVEPMDNVLSPNELEYSGTVLLKNYSTIDQIKVLSNKERKSLYYYIGNKQLNLATSSDLQKYAGDLSFPSLTASNGVLVEEGSSGGKITTKRYTFEYDATSTKMKNGKVNDISSDDKGKSFPYFLSMYLDSNLLVEKNAQGYYEITGYANDNLINTEAFTSRADRYTGVFDSLLTILPTFSPVEGKFLGFDLSKLQIKSLMNLFQLQYWTDLIVYSILNAEQVLSGLGIYYVYVLLVLVILGYAMPETIYKWVFNPVKFMTFGKLDLDNINVPKFVTTCVFTIVLLTLVYNGFIRVLMIKAEEVRQVVADYFIYPFL